ADLSLIAISECLEISAIATLDSDFDVYRLYRKKTFERVFLPA
ncbi:MAG: VapC toxin family PIN domain ribonuclease, partial [Cyanobacteria bacterium QH_8_48_120]